MPDLHHLQIVWFDTPKNLHNSSTFKILSVFPFIDVGISYIVILTSQMVDFKPNLWYSLSWILLQIQMPAKSRRGVVAQLVEQLPLKQLVLGSSPSHSTKELLKPMTNFTRTIENFVCDNCRTQVSGDGYTNHCPNCLWSKHVDVTPGDRAHICKGLMKPAGFDLTRGILHRCTSCRFEKYNKVQTEDNYEKILELSAML